MSSRPSRGAARLAAILDALPDGLVLVNCNGTVVNANTIALGMFETPGTALVGRGLLDLLPSFDSRLIPGSMRRPDPADERGRTKPMRMMARRTDGGEFPVEVTSASLEDGREAYDSYTSYTGDELLMLVVRDLTGTLDTEAELARSQRQTEMILRAASEGVVGTDTDGRVVLVNPAFAQILGYRAGELGGAELHPLILPKRADGTPFPYEESPLADTLKSGRKHRVRGQVLWSKAGDRVPVDLTTAPVRDGDQLVGAVMTFTDRRPHEELVARQEELVEKHATELAELTERHAVELADRAERHAAEREAQAERYASLASRNAQLTAVLTESLRGPLEELRGALGSLAADDGVQLWPEANRLLHHLVAGSARMTALIDNVLGYQLLDAGEEELDRKVALLDGIVTSAIDAAVELIGPGRAQFAVHAPPIEAEVDAGRLKTALAHLVADVAGVDATGRTRASAQGAAGPADSTIVVAAAQRGEVVRIEVRGPYAGGDPVHGPIVRGIVAAHGGVVQTHEVPGTSGGAYVLEVPIGAGRGTVPAGELTPDAETVPTGEATLALAAAPEAGPEAGPEAEPEAGLMSGPEAGPTSRPEAGPTSGPMSGPMSVPAPGPVAGPMSVPAPGPTSGPISRPMPGPTSRPMPVPMSGPASGPTPVPMSGPMPGATPVSTPGPMSGPASGPTSGPTPVATPGPMSGPTPGPTPVPMSGPASGPAPTPGPVAGLPADDAPGASLDTSPGSSPEPEGAPEASPAGVPAQVSGPVDGGTAGGSGRRRARRASTDAFLESATSPEGGAGAVAVPAAGGGRRRARTEEAAGPAELIPAQQSTGVEPTGRRRGRPAEGSVVTAAEGAQERPALGAAVPPQGVAPVEPAGAPALPPVPQGGALAEAERPTGRRRRALAAAQERAAAAEAGPRTPFALPPAEADRDEPPAPDGPESEEPQHGAVRDVPAGHTPPLPHPLPAAPAATAAPGPVPMPAPTPASGTATPSGAGTGTGSVPLPPELPMPAPVPAPAAPLPKDSTQGRAFSVRTLGQGVPFAPPAQAGTPVAAPSNGSGRRRKLATPPELDPPAPAPASAPAPAPLPTAAPAPVPAPESEGRGRAYAIGAPAEGSDEGPEPLDGPGGAVEVVNRPAPLPVDDELPPEPLDNPRRLLVWPAPDVTTQQALSDRGYRPVIVHSREEVDAQIAAFPAALFVDPLTGPITRTALQSLRQAAVSAEVPVLLAAGLGQTGREEAYGADPAVLLKALAPRDSEQHPSRVLVIEENEHIAGALAATLERRGMQVVRAATDTEAVALAGETRPNLVVMDLMQVRRRRAGIIDWLRANGQLNRTPLVVYTSAGLDAERLPELSSGETVLFLAERSNSAEVQARIVDLLAKIGTN
ncbi:PAS domain-containing protein [Streptomyces sp. R302]|uniref:PAS domain-containing protein n=1 Tax=unclassified Streptomyces TaxID=2593676 RepID=UPI00145EB99A|nr:PAS domain-containing protein [Streptomyces sp. R301]NML83263.1 PAS domain-containing protein [Streptomyces sp. R302]